MSWTLSLPALLLLAWGIAGLLWWDRRRHVIGGAQLPWTMAAMGLVAVAMVLALVSVPAPLPDQIVRAFLLCEACYGFAVLARRGADARRR
jgi:hypothetical protein